MINAFDNFFFNITPKTDSIWLEMLSNISAPKFHLVFWFLLSFIVFSQKKLETLNSKAFYLFKQTCIVMFICGIIKITAGRARPFMLSEGISGFTFFKTGQEFLSFPSSHSAIAMALTHFIQKTYKQKKLIYIFPVLIGVSRLILNVHFASDIITGLLIGYLVSVFLQKYYLTILKFYLKIIKNSFTRKV